MRRSPYVVHRRDGRLSNILTGKIVTLGKGVWQTLRGLSEPIGISDLQALLHIDLRRAQELASSLLAAKVLYAADYDCFVDYAIRFADIEINSHCNARCRYCPVSRDPLPPRSMSTGLFELVVSRFEEHRVEWVSLNHYNEPLLDAGFLEKVDVLRSHGLPLRLFTNGTLLTPTLSRRLSDLGNVEKIVVNLPSDEATVYERKMGVPMRPEMMSQLRQAADMRLPLTICINGQRAAETDWSGRVCDVLGTEVEVYENLTHNRAGHIHDAPEIVSTERWHGQMRGCRRMLEHLHINLDAEVFLCCQDYYQSHKLGDLKSAAIHNIMTGRTAVKMRRQIFGEEDAPASLMCRRCIELIKPCGDLETADNPPSRPDGLVS